MTSEKGCPGLPDFSTFQDNLDILSLCVVSGFFDLTTNKTFLITVIDLGAVACGPWATILDHLQSSPLV